MRHNRKNLLRDVSVLLTACSFVMSLGSCSDEPTYDALDKASILTDITLHVTDPLPLLIGTDSLVSFSVSPESATTKELEWTSADESIAKVDEDGRIYANSVGDVKVSVKSKAGYVATATLTVKVVSEIIKAQSITISSESSSIYETNSMQLTASILPETTTYTTLKWTSETPDIATVSETGILKALKAGTAKIKATATDGSGVEGSIEVIVKKLVPVTDIIIDESDLILAVGEKGKLNMTIKPADATVSALSWSSSNSDIVSIDSETGIFTVNGAGSATLTAKLDNFEKSFNVTVPEGKINDTFDYGCNWAKWTTNAKTVEVTTDDDGTTKLTVTPVHVGGLNYKGLIYRSISTTLSPKSYPIIAARIKYKGKSDGGPNYLANIWSTDNKGWGGYYQNQTSKVKNNAMHRIELSNNRGTIHYFDMSNGAYAFGSTQITSTTTIDRFQYEVWEMKYDDEGNNSYDLYWVKSFKSVDELNEYLEKEKLTD